jgi:hypothetical protein
LLDYLAELLPPLRNGEGILKENMPHNFFLPKYSDRKGYMASKDAMYIGKPYRAHHCRQLAGPGPDGAGTCFAAAASMADHAVLGEGRDLWARVTGKLPRTPGSLYSAPFIANVSDYQVRYVSLSTGSRTFPCRNHETMSDWELEAFYKGWVRERYGDAAEWDRMYTIWVGPPTATKLPKMAEDQPGAWVGLPASGSANLGWPADMDGCLMDGRASDAMDPLGLVREDGTLPGNAVPPGPGCEPDAGDAPHGRPPVGPLGSGARALQGQAQQLRLR